MVWYYVMICLSTVRGRHYFGLKKNKKKIVYNYLKNKGWDHELIL
jgi:hypothetical protein